MIRDRTAPAWQGDRVVDPDNEATWLAVDAFPTEHAAAADFEGREFVRVWWKLRWLDLDDEDDAYLHEEWDCETTVEMAAADDDGAREFWLVVTHPDSPYNHDASTGSDGA